MARFKVVSFDVWNTLLDLEAMTGFIIEGLVEATGRPEGAVRAAFNEARSKARVRRARFESANPLAESQAILASLLDTSLDRVRRGITLGVIRALDNVDKLVYPDALEGLREASNYAEKVAVLGNVLFWPGSYTRLILEKAKLSLLIDFQLYSDEIGAYKPDRLAFHALCREVGVDPEYCVHVGNSVSEDAGGALAAGMWAVIVDRKGVIGEALLPGARLGVIRSLRRLGRVLAEFASRLSA